jgi:predicted nuclease of predicted toxin-antitoxin system
MNYLLDTNIVLIYARNNDFILLTTDNDFNHLDEVYLDLQNINLADFKN